MDDFEMCGNDLKFLLWRMNGPGPSSRKNMQALASMTQTLVKILASSQVQNSALASEMRAKSGKSLVAAAHQLSQSGAVHAA